MTSIASLGRSPMTISAHLRSSMIKRALASVPIGGSVTEIGAGRGAWAFRFATAGYDYVGYEPDAESFAAAQRTLAGAGSGRVVNDFLPDVPDRPSDVVAAFEILEHIEQDAAAVRAWFDWLNPGGLLIVSVPAHQARFGNGDMAVGHYRRYERGQLTDLLGGAGFEGIEVRSVGFPAGFALEAVRNRLLAGNGDGIEDRTAASGRRLQPSGRSGWLTAMAALPFRWIQRPFERTDLGTGYVATARRPGIA